MHQFEVVYKCMVCGLKSIIAKSTINSKPFCKPDYA